MSSLWELSTDTVVTTLIVAGISALSLAWLMAGRRQPPARRTALEQRRLEGREAEIYDAPAAPPLRAAIPEMDAELALPQEDIPAPSPEPAWALDPQTLKISPDEKVEAVLTLRSPSLAREAPEEPPARSSIPMLVLEPAVRTPASPPEPKPAAPLSAQQASAMSIAAALIRHDKRAPAPLESRDHATALQPASCAGGDDLTAINGIDSKLAKEMNDLGVRYFDQISDWTPDHAAWVASRLSASVTSDQRKAWIVEAKALANQAPAVGSNRASQGS